MLADVVDLPQAVAEQVQPRLQAAFEQKVAEVVASHGDDQVDQRKLREELIGQYRLVWAFHLHSLFFLLQM